MAVGLVTPSRLQVGASTPERTETGPPTPATRLDRNGPPRKEASVKILLVGNTGVIGSAVEACLRERGHTVLGASRTNAERPTDLSDPDSIGKTVDQAGPVDAIACAAGHAAYGPVGELSGSHYRDSLGNKSLGQIELVL